MIFSFLYKIAPFFTFIRPAIVSQSSFCPLPATPATPRISPLLRLKETSRKVFTPSSFSVVRWWISKRLPVYSLLGRSIESVTFLPTISSVSFNASVSPVLTVATLFPLRKIATLSLISRTSFNLCVMIMTVQPLSRIFRKILKRFLLSCGVSTAVGSSRIRIFASL